MVCDGLDVDAMDAKPVAPEEIKEGDVDVKATDSNAAAAGAPKPAATTEDVPDPDEDDLDDLDGETRARVILWFWEIAKF